MFRVNAFIILCLIFISGSLLAQQKFYEYYEKGKSYASSENWEKAAEMFENAIKLRSDDTGERVRMYGTKFLDGYYPNRELGRAYIYLGKLDKAKEYLDKSYADAYTPETEDLLVKLGDPSSFVAKTPKQKEEVKKEIVEEITTSPPLLTTSDFVFAEQTSDNALEAGEKGTISFSILNKGKGIANNVKVKVQKNNRTVSFKDATVGNINPGESKEVVIPVEAASSVKSAEIPFTIKILESDGFDAADINFTFSTLAVQPLLEIANTGISDEQGNANSQIEHAEVIEIKSFVQNSGNGRATKVKAEIRVTDPNISLLSYPDGKIFDLGTIESGYSKPIAFSFIINNRFKDKHIPISIKLSESTGDFGKTIGLGFEMNQVTLATKDIKITPIETKKDIIVKELPPAVIDIDVDIPRSKANNKDAIAIIFGNRDYQKTKSVEFAINDARSMKNYLVNTLGFKDGNIFMVENATQTDFRTFFGVSGNHKGKLFNTVKKNISDVFIFYAGHGAPGLNDKNGYFVPVECDPQYVELGGYPLDVFYENLSKIPANSFTIILDACFSGATIFENISPIVIQMKNPVMSLSNGIVITSSAGSQVSSWYNEKKHGMFTYFFLKAIHNKNADFNRDGKLTFDELYKYISDESEGIPYYARRIHGVEQTPTLQGKDKTRIFVKY